MSAKIAGTRQVRRQINHYVFSARIVYGCPVFMTVTPSERHSGLAIRLSRFRKNDPGVRFGAPELLPWIGHSAPHIFPASEEDAESISVELPEYDLRRTITSRDPLCAVYAFLVNVKVILPSLYGLRMCPDCPNCCTSENPCMDSFGSNATPMGGSAGRTDAFVGAVEAQKAEGVLHLHMFIFPQMLHQHKTLHDIGESLKNALVTVDAMKRFVSLTRRASYPDLDKFNSERSVIEASWPAYAKDLSLSRPPYCASINGTTYHGCGSPICEPDETLNSEQRLSEGYEWKLRYEKSIAACHVQDESPHSPHQ